MLRIERLEITNINSISELNIDFADGVNIICGENGIGKTTILECLSSSFSSTVSRDIRPNVNHIHGSWSVKIASYDHRTSESHFIISKNPDKSSRSKRDPDVIYYNTTNRDFRYRTTSLDINPKFPDEVGNVKRWLYRNYYASNDRSFIKDDNLALIQECFCRLDPRIEFFDIEEKEIAGSPPFSAIGRVVNTSRRIIELLVKTQHGIVNFEFLSSGYRATLIMIMGIIRRIETINKVRVRDFDGLVLVDEIDLHLHPEWQSRIIDLLRWLIPNAQIIVSTHSPHVVQRARPGEIIPLGTSSLGNTVVRDLPESSDFGYQGWTIEEILVHVMGLKNPMSTTFQSVLNEFERALKSEDHKAIIQPYRDLISMLHYRNPLTALLRIQAGELLEGENWN